MSADTVTGLFRRVPTRLLVYGMCAALLGTMGFIGKSYDKRIEALENHKKQQNGHLAEIQKAIVEIQTDLKWIKRQYQD